MNRRQFLQATAAGATATILAPAARALAPLTGEQVELILPEEPEIVLSPSIPKQLFIVDDHECLNVRYGDVIVRASSSRWTTTQREADVNVQYVLIPEGRNTLLPDKDELIVFIWKQYGIERIVRIAASELRENTARFSGALIG